MNKIPLLIQLIFLAVMPACHEAEKPEKKDQALAGDWPEVFKEVTIPSSLDNLVQKALFYTTPSKVPKALIVSLHTWSNDYLQKDPLAPMILERGWNYIHPDFRVPNTRPEACGSDKALRDIEDAIRFAIQNGNVDTDNIHLIGNSGGGYATLLMYMRTDLDIRSFSAWVPISNLVDWYWLCRSRELKYAQHILQCMSSKDLILDVDEAQRRSPFFLDTPVAKRKKSQLNIYCGIHDGYTGSVPITQSIYFYNKLVGEMNGPEKDLVPERDISLMLSKRSFEPLIKEPADSIDGRHVHYRKSFQSIHLTVFEGGHEILPGAAKLEFEKMINHQSEK